MATKIDGETIKRALLEALESQSRTSSPYTLNSVSVLREACQKLGITNDSTLNQAVLTAWHDLYRAGHISWGTNISNVSSDFVHLSEKGRMTLRQISRDPANPDGYREYLTAQGTVGSIAMSYISEALNTYNANCFKATAVMVGVAAEAMVLDLRDTLVRKIKSLGQPVPRKMQSWMAKEVLDAIKEDLNQRKKLMPLLLAEAYEANWNALTWQTRTIRNSAGHPESSIRLRQKRCMLLCSYFLKSKLTNELKAWIEASRT